MCGVRYRGIKGGTEVYVLDDGLAEMGNGLAEMGKAVRGNRFYRERLGIQFWIC